MLTEADIDIVLTRVRLTDFGFVVDDSDIIDIAEQLFGKADGYGVGDDSILSAYWLRV